MHDLPQTGLFSSGHLDTNTGDFTVPVAGCWVNKAGGPGEGFYP